MTTDYRWEPVETIEATDDNGNFYRIDQEQYVATVRPISGDCRPRSTRGRIRFRCEGQTVKTLPDGKFKLPSGIILTPTSPK